MTELDTSQWNEGIETKTAKSVAKALTDLLQGRPALDKESINELDHLFDRIILSQYEWRYSELSENPPHDMHVSSAKEPVKMSWSHTASTVSTGKAE